MANKLVKLFEKMQEQTLPFVAVEAMTQELMNIEEIDPEINSLLYNVELNEGSSASQPQTIIEEEEECIEKLLETYIEPED